MPTRVVYEEADQEVAAYLLQQGKVLLDTTAIPSKSYRFIFDNSEGDCESTAKRFLSAPEKDYANALKDIRRSIALAKNRYNKKKAH